eukprot:1753806-Rhodomonas_salina.3
MLSVCGMQPSNRVAYFAKACYNVPLPALLINPARLSVSQHPLLRSCQLGSSDFIDGVIESLLWEVAIECLHKLPVLTHTLCCVPTTECKVVCRDIVLCLQDMVNEIADDDGLDPIIPLECIANLDDLLTDGEVVERCRVGKLPQYLQLTPSSQNPDSYPLLPLPFEQPLYDTTTLEWQAPLLTVDLSQPDDVDDDSYIESSITPPEPCTPAPTS